MNKSTALHGFAAIVAIGAAVACCGAPQGTVSPEDMGPKRVPIQPNSITNTASDGWINYKGTFEHTGTHFTLKDEKGAPFVEFAQDDVKVDGEWLKLRKGAKPRLLHPQHSDGAVRTSVEPNSPPRADCKYMPDECDSEGESGCTYCIGALLFCCGGGLTSGCIGAWSCPSDR